MARPQRIAYEDAYYHVMNRGRGRHLIFPAEPYFQAFVHTLAEAHDRFRVIIHAYCLLPNHYHLLVQTPHANLSRVMRHINGVYTQRHNTLNKTDGPLFRGRFKAILVEADAYLLQLSRYIHRNPIEMKRPLVEELSQYRWSSYPSYIGLAKAPWWIDRELTYGLLGTTQRYAGYKRYVEAGVDEETEQLYSRERSPAVIGSAAFRTWLYEAKAPKCENTTKTVAYLAPAQTIDALVKRIAVHYGEPVEALRMVKRGRRGKESRKVAMYLCQQLLDSKLEEIGRYFGLRGKGGVSFALHQIKAAMGQDEQLRRRVEALTMEFLNQDT